MSSCEHSLIPNLSRILHMTNLQTYTRFFLVHSTFLDNGEKSYLVQWGDLSNFLTCQRFQQQILEQRTEHQSWKIKYTNLSFWILKHSTIVSVIDVGIEDFAINKEVPFLCLENTSFSLRKKCPRSVMSSPPKFKVLPSSLVSVLSVFFVEKNWCQLLGVYESLWIKK